MESRQLFVLYLRTKTENSNIEHDKIALSRKDIYIHDRTGNMYKCIPSHSFSYQVISSILWDSISRLSIVFVVWKVSRGYVCIGLLVPTQTPIRGGFRLYPGPVIFICRRMDGWRGLQAQAQRHAPIFLNT